MKEIKLNFNLEEKTTSGKIYNEENFRQKIDERIKNSTLFLEYSGRYSSMEVDLKDIIGFVESYKVSKDGEVVFDVSPNTEGDTKKLNVIDECVLSATGYIDKRGNTLINNVICLRPTQEYNFIFDDMDEEGEEDYIDE